MLRDEKVNMEIYLPETSYVQNCRKYMLKQIKLSHESKTQYVMYPKHGSLLRAMSGP